MDTSSLKSTTVILATLLGISGTALSGAFVCGRSSGKSNMRDKILNELTCDAKQQYDQALNSLGALASGYTNPITKVEEECKIVGDYFKFSGELERKAYYNNNKEATRFLQEGNTLVTKVEYLRMTY